MTKNLSTRHSKKQEGLQKKAHERYQDISEEKKNKKQSYGHERDKNLPEDKKTKTSSL